MKKSPKGKALAIFGTGSDVGKSVVATALCRIFVRQGLSVAPFKAQNMSNNSWVCKDGGEIGRAQVVQAEAAKVEPDVRMNPVLLKPCSETGAQLIVKGFARGQSHAADYFRDTSLLAAEAFACLHELMAEKDMVVIEGAGSCAEVNLRSRDFVNFASAEAAQSPVILVADIDRGGVFGQIVGSLEVLSPEDKKFVKGIIINRFRGDLSLFTDGVTYLEQKCKLPVLGVIPWFYDMHIDSEDALPLDIELDPVDKPAGEVNIAILRLPHISNFTDFEALRTHKGVCLHYLATPRDLSDYDLVLLPGSKSVLFDLEWLRKIGWEAPLLQHVKHGGRLAGICGGLQMLGEKISDPLGIEGSARSLAGLGLLPITTELRAAKQLSRSKGHENLCGAEVSGYEIHCGESRLREGKAFAQLERGVSDGAINSDGRVWGSYLHGLFDDPNFRSLLLRQLKPSIELEDYDWSQKKQDSMERLADHFEKHLDLEKIKEICSL